VKFVRLVSSLLQHYNKPHNHTTTQPHSHTATQPHNHTTTQPQLPHNHKPHPTQPRYHIFTLCRRFGQAPEAIMPPQDLAIRRDIDRVVQTLNCQIYSRHCQRNLQNAVRRCTVRVPVVGIPVGTAWHPEVVLSGWRDNDFAPFGINQDSLMGSASTQRLRVGCVIPSRLYATLRPGRRPPLR
jgi:hypothetical protein